MLECHKDEWVVFSIDEQKSVLYAIWHDDGTLTAQKYKEQLKIAKAIVQQYKPTKSINDARKFSLSISPALQTWIGENIFQKKGEEIIKKYAFVVANSIFAQISLEQMMEESERTDVSQYFDDIEAAKLWLDI